MDVSFEFQIYVVDGEEFRRIPVVLGGFIDACPPSVSVRSPYAVCHDVRVPTGDGMQLPRVRNGVCLSEHPNEPHPHMWILPNKLVLYIDILYLLFYQRSPQTPQLHQPLLVHAFGLHAPSHYIEFATSLTYQHNHMPSSHRHHRLQLVPVQARTLSLNTRNRTTRNISLHNGGSPHK